MIDTHCHLTFKEFNGRVEQVIAAAANQGVDRMISVGVTPADARNAFELTEAHANVFSTVGVHPHYADQVTDRDELVVVLTELAAHSKVVALGEMGLDYHYSDPPVADQKRVFTWQLDLIAGLDAVGGDGAGKPIIIHNRKATDDVVGMIRDSGIAGERFVFHCFTGASDDLDKILDLGAMVSFTGISTFKNAKDVAACAASMPADRIMIETDSPYLTPEPHRKVWPNEPQYVACVARFLAEVRGEDEQAFIQQVDANAVGFFKLP